MVHHPGTVSGFNTDVDTWARSTSEHTPSIRAHRQRATATGIRYLRHVQVQHHAELYILPRRHHHLEASSMLFRTILQPLIMSPALSNHHARIGIVEFLPSESQVELLSSSSACRSSNHPRQGVCYHLAAALRASTSTAVAGEILSTTEAHLHLRLRLLS